MKLDEILALHPGKGADAATLVAAVATAQAKRKELLATLAEAERVRAGPLLATDDKKLQAAERAASDARLAADRIGELLPMLQADLGRAQGAETIADLRAMMSGVTELDAAVMDWWAKEFPKMIPIAAAGMQAFNVARDAREDFLAKVESAFRSQDVRNAAPDGLGVEVPPKRNNPALLFLMWSFKNG